MCCGPHSSRHKCCVVMNSWLCLPNILTRRSVHVCCGLVHSALCMLFHVRSCQGAEEYTGTQGPGPSEKPGFWKHYFSALAGSLLHHSLDDLPNRIILCAPSFLPLSTNVLVVNPNALVRRTYWQHQRTQHLQGQALRAGAADGKPTPCRI